MESVYKFIIFLYTHHGFRVWAEEEKKKKERAVKESLHSGEEAEMALSPEMLCPGRTKPADVKTAKTGGDTRDVLGTGQSSK